MKDFEELVGKHITFTKDYGSAIKAGTTGRISGALRGNGQEVPVLGIVDDGYIPGENLLWYTFLGKKEIRAVLVIIDIEE